MKEERQRVWESREWKKFRRHRLALLGGFTLFVLILLAIFAPLAAPQGPYAMNIKEKESPPSREHILGTDTIGRDNWARLIYGTRVSLAAGIGAVAIYVIIGMLLGLLSGYFGGVTDMVIQRMTDVVLAFPQILIIIVFVAVFGTGLRNVILGIGLFGWTVVCRIVRAEVLSLRERDFVMAARCVGASHKRIVFRHILPNVVAPLVVIATLGVAYAIITETSLSFLGLGVQPPTPSWGNMIYQALSLRVLETMPWIWVPPGVFIATCVLSINFVGDGLRDALDPRQRE
jgi:peptide/nickel transport system permease protein